MSDASAVVEPLAGRSRPTAGHIGADAADVHGRFPAALAPFRRKLGMVFQMAALEETCAFPLVEHTDWRPA